MKLASNILRFKTDLEGVYQIRFGPKAITWECLRGKDKGSSRTVFYETVEIASKEHFVTWLNADNEVVRMIANLKNKTISYNFKNKGIRQFSKGEIIFFGPPAYANDHKILKALKRIWIRKETNRL
ncbi:MAG: hypothetical protein R3250_05165 [Melioribacteraceae bacterium]|nr:hypothetical protein [Melioribacteraceae bacterium]